MVKLGIMIEGQEGLNWERWNRLIDDAERLVLRIDAQIFVGTVFAELQSIRFDNPNQG